MKAKAKTNHSKEARPQLSAEIAAILKNAPLERIKPDLIEYSPLNYRQYYSEDALFKFADEIKQHGIISSLIVRPLPGKKFQLVSGERRLRAARIATLTNVPVSIADLTDDQVIEVQLSENIQRENPHPFHEAQAIGRMQETGLKMEEIATRLGKSEPYIFTRLRLLKLTEAFREMFMAGVITMTDALMIASLSQDSQTEFFNEECSKWKKSKHFRLYNLDNSLRIYRYNLHNAPFDTKDKDLVPEAGACTNCPFNSATLKSLFPETADRAVCTSKECFRKKCTAHLLASLITAVETYLPTAILYDNQLSEAQEAIIPLATGATDIPRHNINEITTIQKPRKPLKDHHKCYGNSGKYEFDQDSYDEAMDTYTKELDNYNLHTTSGHYEIGVFINENDCQPVYFNLEKPRPQRASGKGITAKEVQEAIKSGTATPELLQAEIQRLQEREKRKQQIIADNVQLEVHRLMFDFAKDPANHTGMTTADHAATRWLIYDTLAYIEKEKVNKYLVGRETVTNEELFTMFVELTEQQFSFIVRLALCHKSEGKYPKYPAGYVLYQMAQQAGIPVATVEQAQAAETAERKQVLDEKVAKLKKDINKLKRKNK